MNTLFLALQILSAIPIIQVSTVMPPEQQAEAMGEGTLIVAACEPRETITVTSPHWSVTAEADSHGVATIEAPAQNPDDEHYRIMVHGIIQPLNGALAAGEILSGTCP